MVQNAISKFSLCRTQKTNAKDDAELLTWSQEANTHFDAKGGVGFDSCRKKIKDP
jgi:hypothetical protein